MATVRWTGAAQDVQGISTWTFADTFATGDTVDVEINNKHLILTLGTDVTLADVAAETAAMINAKDADTGKTGNTLDETRNFGGGDFAEFSEVKASSSGAVLTIKTTPGVPVTIAISVTTAGDGTVGSETVVQAATGKHFFKNADNWEGGVLPQGDDTIVFDAGSVSVLYGLDNELEELHVYRTNDYTGDIGLPEVNPLGYIEYRQRYLDLPTNSSGGGDVTIGELFSTVPPRGRTFIDFGTETPTDINLTVYDAPQRNDGDFPVQIVGGQKLVVDVHSGSVLIGGDLLYGGQQTLLTSVTVSGDGDVVVGSNGVLDDPCTVTINSGKAVLAASVTSSAAIGINVHDGTLDANNITSSGTLQCRGGTTRVSNSTITTGNVYGGATLSEGTTAATITTTGVHQGATINNRRGLLTFTNGLDLHGCQPSDVTLSFPDHKTWTPSAI